MTKLILKLIVIFGIQIVLTWFFYRCRVISHETWAGSDFMVFVLPLLGGFVVAACVLFLSFPGISLSKRVAATLGLSAVGALVAFFAGTVIAFNLYGT